MSKVREHIFKFKQFELSNKNSAMKIGTDGVLLGAWCDVGTGQTIWDVGAGTGLIALMLAQRCNGNIVGIEIDPAAANEARLNAAQSPWDTKVEIAEGDVMKIADNLPQPDLIVSNPPFFGEGLRAPEKWRGIARSGDSLGFVSLIRLAASHLSDAGELAMISPRDAQDEIEFEAAMCKLHIRRKCIVHSKAGGDAIRILWQLTRNAGPMKREELYIRDASGEYSQEYRAITKDFYLNL